jgi:hypothetical protein
MDFAAATPDLLAAAIAAEVDRLIDLVLGHDRAIARARRMIDARQYALDSDWGDVQVRADAP